MVMVVPQRYGFNEHGLMIITDPEDVAEYSYVNMYHHHDGYPEWQGVQLANWKLVNTTMDIARAAGKLVRDMYYDSCFLYPAVYSIDHQYTYIVWVGSEKISCFERYNNNKHVFTMTPLQIKTKYENLQDYDYTDFANGQTRYDKTRSNPSFTELNKRYNKLKAGLCALYEEQD